MLRPCLGLLSVVASMPFHLPGQTADDPATRAAAAIQAAIPRAQADPSHPIFHITAPAQWINDPNGPVFHSGYYHLFYQLHPFSDSSGPKYWGHVRSRDLVKWEHLPIALCPSSESGESEVWSGCCTINGRGQPMLFYTSIAAGQSPMDHAEQWAATGDDTLLYWHKVPSNPVLSEALHGGRKIYDWRDPFIFRVGRQPFLATGGNLNRANGGQAVVNVYEAENAELTQWTYRGVLFKHPDPDVRTIECPNFFRLGDRWVLLVSPYGKVQYFVGDFDASTCRFHPHTRGVLDFGPNWYAPNTMQLSDGRRLVWGWVNGFPPGHGWNGCLSLPRQLSLSRDGQLLQQPIPQLRKLRGQATKWRTLPLAETEKPFNLPDTNTLEILASINLQNAQAVSLDLQSGDTNEQPVRVRFDGSELAVLDAVAPLPLAKNQRIVELRIFLDRSVLEVFANQTVCLTKTLRPLSEPTLRIRSEAGNATADLLQIWPLKPIW